MARAVPTCPSSAPPAGSRSRGSASAAAQSARCTSWRRSPATSSRRRESARFCPAAIDACAVCERASRIPHCRPPLSRVCRVSVRFSDARLSPVFKKQYLITAAQEVGVIQGTVFGLVTNGWDMRVGAWRRATVGGVHGHLGLVGTGRNRGPRAPSRPCRPGHYDYVAQPAADVSMGVRMGANGQRRRRRLEVPRLRGPHGAVPARGVRDARAAAACLRSARRTYVYAFIRSIDRARPERVWAAGTGSGIRVRVRAA